MKKIISLILISIILLTALEAPVFGMENNDLCYELDSMVHSMIDNNKSKGAVLSIVQNGKITLCKGYGYADEYLGYAADGVKIGFRIGSVSKTFVAVAAQMLKENGLLDMNVDVSKYLGPDFPKLAYPVTMQHLLTHTAGFEDMVTGMAVYNVSDTEPLEISVIKYLPHQQYKPGAVISYSNYGIALAAYVIESIAGQSFDEFCEEQIFEPLEMNRTTFKHMHDIVYVSKPYLPGGNETIEPYMNLYPEGSAVSTAEDMAKYMQWLLSPEDNRLLSKEAKREMFDKQFAMSVELEGVGYIWNRYSRNNKLYFSKKGETLNFYSRIALYPEENTGIFLSFNTYVPEHEINAIMNRATDLIYGIKEFNEVSGRATIDIKGLYVNNWTSFNTAEKILRYIVPGKIIYISGDMENGYYIGDDKMTLVNENMYASKIGLLKFQNNDNTTIISSEGAISYIKVPLWQHTIVIVTIPILFLAATIIVLIKEAILFLRKKNKKNDTLLLNSIYQIISFAILCFLMYKGIKAFSLLKMTLPMMFLGLLILVTTTSNIIYMKKTHCFKDLLSTTWVISSILFVAWMCWFQII
jgi:CubicO group peptidase (beta-lactamase class C family)